MSTGSLILLTHHHTTGRIVQSIRRDYFENITTIGKTCTINCVEVFPNMLFEQTKSGFVQRTVIHRILQGVVVPIFSLPLQSSRTTLIETPRRRLRNHAENRSVES